MITPAFVVGAPQPQWTLGEATKKWKSPTYDYLYDYPLAALELLVLKHKHQWPIGGQKEFTKDPLGSLQALIDFAIGHRDAGRPLYTMMGGWTKMSEILLDMAKMIKEFRFKGKTLHWESVNLAVGFSPAWSECHPRVTKLTVGGNAGPEGGAHGPVGKCGWVAVLVGEEQPAAGTSGRHYVR